MSAVGAPAPTPVVSVLMTTFNGAGFIGASIASVLAQSFSDFELIVVDDGSTDTMAQVLAGIGDPRLRVLRQAVNGGVVAARNAGFLAARGRYVAALDHDDLSHPERLARQVAYLDAHPGVVLVATEIEIEEPAGRKKGLPRPLGAWAAKRTKAAGGDWRSKNPRCARARTPPPPGPPHRRRSHADPLAVARGQSADLWSSVMFRADAVRRWGRSCAPTTSWRTISIFLIAC